MSLGGLFGKKHNYASEYAGYRPNQPASIFEKYVDETPGLLDAWEEIEGEPQGTQGSYWIPRGASSKSAFGRAHAAEDSALSGGTYHGGTNVKPYSGKTTFESFLDLLSGGETTDTTPSPFGEYTGSNTYYPVMDTDYTSPSAPSWAEAGGGLISDSYAPWSKESLQTSTDGWVPQNIWEGDKPLTGLGYGVEYNAPRFGPITGPAPETEGTSGTSTTDTSGSEWIMSPGGQWYPSNSDYAIALNDGTASYANHYDSNGNYIGANE